MKTKRKKEIKLEAGKFCLDISKLIFGGVVLAGIMKQDIDDYTAVFTVGLIVFCIIALTGFQLIYSSKEDRRK